MNEQWDVVIVGGGVAGLSAALILARARRRVLVLDAGEQRNRVTAHMHGVLGHDGRSPMQLVADGRAEVESFGGVIRSMDVASATLDPDGFVLNSTIHARKLLVATGLVDDLPPIPGLATHWGAQAVACPYCDGYEARGLRIAAMSAHQALLLAQWSDRVTLYGVAPDEEWRARLAVLGVDIDERPIERVVGERDQLEGIVVGGEPVEVDRIFVAATPRPRAGLLRTLGAEVVEMPPMGEWVRVEAGGATSVPGLRAVGNVVNPAALVPVAMGEAVAAATAINFELTVEDADRRKGEAAFSGLTPSATRMR
jgi:thioredoxin reductase